MQVNGPIRQRDIGHKEQRKAEKLKRKNDRGFRTRTVYLDYITCLRYTILVENPRFSILIYFLYCYSMGRLEEPRASAPDSKAEKIKRGTG